MPHSSIPEDQNHGVEGTVWERLACRSRGEKPPYSAHKRALSLYPELGLDRHVSADMQVHTQCPKERQTGASLGDTPGGLPDPF